MHADRSQRGRDLAEKALAALLDETRDAAGGLVVVGGLVPPTLVGTGAAHQGTNDVDIVLELAPVFDRGEDDFIWLEQALVQAGFVPAASEPSWRWVLDVDGAVVELEFLVDVSDVRSQAIALPGTTRVAALSVPGPAAALLDHREQVIVGGRTAQFAGLGGYVIAKASAVVGRRKPRDLYDLGFVVLGALRDEKVDLADEVLRARPYAADYDPIDLVRRACAEYDDPAGEAARTFARESRRAGDATSEAILARDASAAMRMLAAALRTGR